MAAERSSRRRGVRGPARALRAGDARGSRVDPATSARRDDLVPPAAEPRPCVGAYHPGGATVRTARRNVVPPASLAARQRRQLAEPSLPGRCVIRGRASPRIAVTAAARASCRRHPRRAALTTTKVEPCSVSAIAFPLQASSRRRTSRPRSRSSRQRGRSSCSSTSSTGRRPELTSSGSCGTGAKNYAKRVSSRMRSRATRRGRTSRGCRHSTSTSSCSRTGTARRRARSRTVMTSAAISGCRAEARSSSTKRASSASRRATRTPKCRTSTKSWHR
jgi:hypothetical protein